MVGLPLDARGCEMSADEALTEMRDAASSYEGRIQIEKVYFGPSKHAVRIMLGRKKVGPLLFPAEGQTIGQCLDLFLGNETT